MGYMRHHGIIVSGLDMSELRSWPLSIKEVHKRALEIFKTCPVSPLSHEVVNGYMSFCVFPDGSKEGWDDSTEGDLERNAFITYLHDSDLDGCSLIDWVEVQFADDEGVSKVLRNSDNYPDNGADIE